VVIIPRNLVMEVAMEIIILVINKFNNKTA